MFAGLRRLFCDVKVPFCFVSDLFILVLLSKPMFTYDSDFVSEAELKEIQQREEST